MIATSQPSLANPWWAGLTAVVAAVVATLLVRAVALTVFDIPAEFLPLAEPGPTIVLTGVGASGAIIVFSFVRRIASRPAAMFRTIALVALLLSLLPDLWLLSGAGSAAFQGATISAVATLIVQNVVAAVVIVGTLTRSGSDRSPSDVV